jgi:hypothetical protein
MKVSATDIFVEFEQACDWFYGLDSHRNPAACMPDHLQPPPLPTQPSQPAVPTQLVPPTKIISPAQPMLPGDLCNIDSVVEREVLWFFGSESRRNPDAVMPPELCPPPMPTSSTAPTGSASLSGTPETPQSIGSGPSAATVSSQLATTGPQQQANLPAGIWTVFR